MYDGHGGSKVKRPRFEDIEMMEQDESSREKQREIAKQEFAKR